MQLDLKNGNTLWREATDLEMSQLAEYDTFRDLGHKDTVPPPTGYKKIFVMLIWKLLPWNEIISLQVLNLVSWKDII
jgi:hypothetical protein